MLHLLRNRSFAALTATQFLGAFNDNAFKQFVLFLVSASATVPWVSESPLAQNYHQVLPSTLFALPFVLFGALTGSLADKASKSRIIKAANLLEIFVMGLALVAFLLQSYVMLLAVVFLMGSQSALFGPAKYGSIRELVGHKELSQGNAVIQTTTMIAILGGVIFAGFLKDAYLDALWIPGAVYIGFAIVGWLISLRIGRLAPIAPERRLTWNVVAEVISHWRATEGHRPLILSIFASSFFYLVGATLLLVVNVYGPWLGLDSSATGELNAMTVFGIAAGAVVAGRLSRGHVEAGLIPIGLIGLAASLLVVRVAPGSVWFLRGALFFAGLSAGVFSIPIRALIQGLPKADHRGSILGLSEMLDFVGILAASAAFYLLADVISLTPPAMFTAIGLGVLVFTIASLFYTAEFAMRLGLMLLVHSVYRIRRHGAVQLPAEGGALLVANHVSFIDAILIAAVSHRPVRFLMYRAFFDIPVVGWFSRKMGAIPVSADDTKDQKREALERAAGLAAAGELVCIFAEGSITRSGTMLPFARGMEMIAKRAGVPIVPVGLDRLWGSIFSFERGKVFWKRPHRIPYPVDLVVGDPLPFDTPAWAVRNRLQELIAEIRSERRGKRGSLAWRFLRSARIHRRQTAVEDSSGKVLTYGRLLTGSLALRSLLRRRLGPEPNVGVLLPPCAAAALTNISLALVGKTSVNLNYTMSNKLLEQMLERAEVRTLLTSRRFLRALDRDAPAAPEVLFVEDLVGEISAWDKLRAAALALLPGFLISRVASPQRSADEPATIIFSSGSTGEPKGVLLSHGNILSNVQGVLQMLSIGREDALLGILPFFHSFGYTVTLWAPLLSGAKAVYHSNPLDVKVIGDLCEKSGATVMLGTPTFYRSYLRRIDPAQLASLRVAMCGAEKLHASLAKQWEEKFGIPLLEGYGCTELSPVVSFNVPDVELAGEHERGNEPGTIGRPLPGLAVRIVNTETREVLGPEHDGLLEVKGPSVMLGYWRNPEATSEVLHDGWYSTGDVARMRRSGFLEIADRLSRFSKIGGEMVPHGRVEEVLQDALEELYGPEDTPELVVTAVADERKGERLVVLHTALGHPVEELLARISEDELPRIFVPRRDSFLEVEEVPKLGTGKVDLKAVKDVARATLVS